jgi:hypothetical protein
MIEILIRYHPNRYDDGAARGGVDEDDDGQVCTLTSSADYQYGSVPSCQSSWNQQQQQQQYLVVIHLLSFLETGTRYRHWSLFLWVLINLTVSALNNADWYNEEVRKRCNMHQERHQRQHQEECDEEREGTRCAIIPFVV